MFNIRKVSTRIPSARPLGGRRRWTLARCAFREEEIGPQIHECVKARTAQAGRILDGGERASKTKHAGVAVAAERSHNEATIRLNNYLKGRLRHAIDAPQHKTYQPTVQRGIPRDRSPPSSIARGRGLQATENIKEFVSGQSERREISCFGATAVVNSVASPSREDPFAFLGKLRGAQEAERRASRTPSGRSPCDPVHNDSHSRPSRFLPWFSIYSVVPASDVAATVLTK
jgi:hypothetical protein